MTNRFQTDDSKRANGFLAPSMWNPSSEGEGRRGESNDDFGHSLHIIFQIIMLFSKLIYGSLWDINHEWCIMIKLEIENDAIWTNWFCAIIKYYRMEFLTMTVNDEIGILCSQGFITNWFCTPCLQMTNWVFKMIDDDKYMFSDHFW